MAFNLLIPACTCHVSFFFSFFLAIKAKQSAHPSCVSLSWPVNLLIDDNDSLQSLSPPLSQRPYPSSPSLNEQAPALPLSLPVFLEAFAPTFYILCSLPEIVPDMPATFSSLPNVVQRCMSHMAPYCTVCYFLRHKCPIKIILTHP